ncbi:MAG: phosphopantothenoylcysteine decarboxylase [Candidatus Omnitrophica bacterium]|nr:phosphopantothenoylcysteine decarboxylase [Candidatus Omnitrophota bacterium]
MTGRKRVLITAGPTWVPLDRVRILTNIAGGETGALLARAFKRRGAKVTLIGGGMSFKDFQAAMRRALRENKYDTVIHSAALVDYAPVAASRGKISSGRKTLTLKLKPTPKVIDEMRKLSPHSTLVGFKFEPDATKDALVKRARALMRRSGCGLVVANTCGRGGYSAYLVTGKDAGARIPSKARLAAVLAKMLL